MFRLELLERRALLATAAVNWADARQTVDGFGASSAWFSGTMPATSLSLLYSPTTGIGLSLLRSRVSPDIGSSEGAIMQQAQQYGAKIWSTPWTPPREWKTNQDNNNGGALDPARYQDYANGLATYILNQRAAGVNLYAVSLQNEPDWTATWESCIWTADQFAAFLPYVASTFSAKGITTKIMLSEQAGWHFNLLSKISSNPALMQYVDIVAAHNYDTSTPYSPVAEATGKRLWETEQSGGTDTTDMAGALPWAVDIYKAFTNAGVNAWHYWWLQAGGSGGVTRSNYVAIKRTWAIGNYSRFVRPGWQFIGSTNDSSLNISAFKDPVSGRFAIVAVNSGTSAVNQTFTFNGFSASRVTPYVTSDTSGDDLAKKADIATSGGSSFVASVGGKSVVTYVGQLTAQPVLQAPENLSVAVVQGNTKSQLAVAWDDASSGETAYSVERSPDGSTWTPIITTLAADSRYYLDPSVLTENTIYYYRVRATSGGSASAYSNVVSARTTLGAPYNLGVGKTTTGTFLGWLDGTNGETKLTIDRSLDGLVWTTVNTSVPSNQTYYNDNSIPGYVYGSNQTYFYRVRAYAGAMASTYVQANTGLSAPTGLNATATPTTINANWTNTAVGAGGVYLEYSDNSGASWVQVSSSMTGSTNSHTFTGLTENLSRRLRVKATAAADSASSSYSPEFNILTPLLAPTNLTATALSPTQVRLNWVDKSSVETAYMVERSGDGNTWVVLTSTLPAGSATIIDSTAVYGAAYTYRVTATSPSNASARTLVSLQGATSTGSFVYDAPVARVDFAFNGSVPAYVSPASLVLTNTTTLQTILPVNFSISGGRVASFTFPAYSAGLPEGNYHAILSGVSSFDFFVLLADANQDRRVNTIDFNVLAANFGLTNRVWSQGDFNYDGLVDSVDFDTLVTKFGSSAVPLPGPLATSEFSRGTSFGIFGARSAIGSEHIDAITAMLADDSAI